MGDIILSYSKIEFWIGSMLPLIFTFQTWDIILPDPVFAYDNDKCITKWIIRGKQACLKIISFYYKCIVYNVYIEIVISISISLHREYIHCVWNNLWFASINIFLLSVFCIYVYLHHIQEIFNCANRIKKKFKFEMELFFKEIVCHYIKIYTLNINNRYGPYSNFKE